MQKSAAERPRGRNSPGSRRPVEDNTCPTDGVFLSSFSLTDRRSSQVPAVTEGQLWLLWDSLPRLLCELLRCLSVSCWLAVLGEKLLLCLQGQSRLRVLLDP